MENSKKFLAVEFSDGTTCVISARFIAEHRAQYYATLDANHGEDFQSVYDTEVNFALKCTDEILDWAANNMDWLDVRNASILWRPSTAIDYEAEWCSANMGIMKLSLGAMRKEEE
jgi:hypothetical protein